MDNVANSQKYVRDSLYYWDSVTFLVEGVLFKVPRRYFEKNSNIWSDVFTLPLGSNQAEGSSDENPIRLESISSIDFQRLLMVMYPENSLSQCVKMNQDQWVSVLKLSTMWGFDEIRKKAIAELSKINMDTLDKVVLARSYSVGDWLYEGYTALVKREASLSFEEAERLGYEIAFRLCQRREAAFRKAGFNLHRSFQGLGTEICATFRAELIDAGHSGRPPQDFHLGAGFLERL
ncbi:hypothetical protein PILCRDRAFT_820414 [Piloderma croceum F 1598]|uniref:BTB domain-containing protein n=1 Tax=Piloderma croceum (strain F 1598) TaxID=765440 RepID=A0A0C3B8D9_PILCF|nr:hypothetical protein PILCRDRAFT_820414 [Piloderma croceum F 1598]